MPTCLVTRHSVVISRRGSAAPIMRWPRPPAGLPRRVRLPLQPPADPDGRLPDPPRPRLDGPTTYEMSVPFGVNPISIISLNGGSIDVIEALVDRTRVRGTTPLSFLTPAQYPLLHRNGYRLAFVGDEEHEDLCRSGRAKVLDVVHLPRRPMEHVTRLQRGRGLSFGLIAYAAF